MPASKKDSKCVRNSRAAELLGLTVPAFLKLTEQAGLRPAWRHTTKFGSLARVWAVRDLERVRETPEYAAAVEADQETYRVHRRDFARKYARKEVDAIRDATDAIERLAFAARAVDPQARRLASSKRALLDLLIKHRLAELARYRFDVGLETATALVMNVSGNVQNYTWIVLPAHLEPQFVASALTIDDIPPAARGWCGPTFVAGEKLQAQMLVRWVVETLSSARGES